MTPFRLAAFRLLLLAFGRVPGFSGALKALLVRILVRRDRRSRYVAQSRFLDLALLEAQAEAEGKPPGKAARGDAGEGAAR